MGREAVCICDWAGNKIEVKALLETCEVILRGGLRKRLSFTELSNVKVQGEKLAFSAGPESITLALGAAAAEKWAATITSPPTPLSKKLGITNTSVVRVIGAVPDQALQEALDEAAHISSTDPNLIVACVDSLETLHAALRNAKAQLQKGVPIWMVYTKGKGRAIDETAIRSLLRDNGMIDTKVASVSAKYTALRFIYRKPK